MSKALFLDLRVRVLAAVEAGALVAVLGGRAGHEVGAATRLRHNHTRWQAVARKTNASATQFDA